MKGFFIVLSMILAILQLSIVPRMPGIGMALNILVPFLLVFSWYAPVWGVIASLIIGFFEIPYTSLVPSFVVLSFVIPCMGVAVTRSVTLRFHPSQAPFPYMQSCALGVGAVVLYIALRVLGGGRFDVVIIVSQALSILIAFQLFTWLMITWYVKNIPKPFFYKRV